MLDVLSDILTRMSLQGSLYFRSSFSEPWGIRIPDFKDVARFHYVHNGQALIRVKGAPEPIFLSQGDLILIPHGSEHIMSCRHSGPEDILPLEDVIVKSGFKGQGALVWGGDKVQSDTQFISGHFAFAHGSRHILFDRLPPYIHIHGYGDDAGVWLEASLKLIGAEAGSAKLGGDLIALKMSEAIFAQAIRTYLEQAKSDLTDISGFTDPQISRALTAFHQRPTANWSVASLGAEAGLSRTGFSEKFSKTMGLPPMQYMTAWRIQLAREALLNKSISVADAADMAGYQSESAFARAFKKETGNTPAAFRKLGRAA